MQLKQLYKNVRALYARDPAASGMLEIVATYPGVHALLLHRLASKLWAWKLRWVARVVSKFGRLMTGIEIHPGAKIGDHVLIDHGMGIVIGETAEIGDGCTLYQGVTLGGLSLAAGKRHPSLGKDVVVGAGAKVMGPIKIGDGAKIGCNAVVLKEVPAFATAVGVPARIILRRQPTSCIANKFGADPALPVYKASPGVLHSASGLTT